MLPPKWDDFPNRNDAKCACGIWIFLAVVFVSYLSIATLGFIECLDLPDNQEVYESDHQLPVVWIRLCELAPLQAAINYSILDHLIVAGRLNYLLPNGTEEIFRMNLTSDADIFFPSPDFRCKRFSVQALTPEDALMPFQVFEVGIEEPFHPKLMAVNGLYTRGLFFGPSLAENATNPHACQEEHLLKIWVPSSKLPKQRNLVMNVVPSQAIWTDTLGGRQGAPCDDTHFFGDISMVMDPALSSLEAKQYLNSSSTKRPTLRIVVPIARQKVEVTRYENDLVGNILSLISKWISASVIFKVLGSVFPQIRQSRHHLLMRIPELGLGTEAQPLVDKSVP